MVLEKGMPSRLRPRKETCKITLRAHVVHRSAEKKGERSSREGGKKGAGKRARFERTRRFFCESSNRGRWPNVTGARLKVLAQLPQKNFFQRHF